jgi:hypothetical protein
MSRIALNGNASGTGTVTIASPNTNSDRTVTLPDATGTLLLNGGAGSFTTLSASSTVSGTGFSTYLASPPAIGGTAAAAGSFTTVSASGNMSFNSGYGSSAVAYGCRAWVNFNGTGTVAIRGSGNVSSITDNGTGDYTINFTTAMPDANYAPTMMCGFGTDSGSPNAHMAEISRDAAPSTTALRIDTMSAGVTQRDLGFVNVAIFR